MVFLVRYLGRGVVLGFVALALLVAPSGSGGGILGVGQAEAQTIREISVEGNRRVAAETVRSYLTMPVGSSYSALQADESLRTLFATGLFADVRIDMRGNRLVVTVEENPIINAVAFEGNRRVTNETLRNEVESEPRGVLTRATVQRDVQRILQVYRRTGRFGAAVQPQIIDLPDNRVNLVFEIDEGDRTAISRINFIGNQAFSDRTLRDVVETRERNWLSWLRSSDIYDPERLEADQEELRRFYLRNGYADFRVVAAVADFDSERNTFFVTFTVDEGPRYRFASIDVESYVSDVDPDTLRRNISTRAGDVYNADRVDNSVEEMSLALANRGYAFAQVRPRGDRNREDNTIAVTYTVEEGPRVYIERINIRGNVRTLDRVVRREFDIAEGDAYNPALIERAERRLERLRYFRRINITREQGSAPDRVVVNVDVVEQATGEIALGGGYSTRDGFIADVSVTERNLLGRGHILRVGGVFGENRQGADFSFTEPHFLNRRLAAGVDAFWQDIDYSEESSYKQETIGGGVRFGFELTPELSVTTRYQLYQTEIRVDGFYADGCPPTCGTRTDGLSPIFYGGTLADGTVVRPPEASIAIKQALGKATYSVAGYSLVYTTIDTPNRPRNGLYVELSQDVAGLGGDVNFFRTEGDARYFRELTPNMVAMVRLRGGHIAGFGGQDVRVTDSFFKGGDLVRGFASAGIGPRDLTPNLNRDSLGGKTYFGGTAEIIFDMPFIPEDFGISAAIFADAGTVFNVGFTGRPGSGPGMFLPQCVSASGPAAVVAPAGLPGCYVDDTELRASIGASLMWDSPFGPLRADIGYAILSEWYDEKQVFRFGASRQF